MAQRTPEALVIKMYTVLTSLVGSATTILRTFIPANTLVMHICLKLSSKNGMHEFRKRKSTKLSDKSDSKLCSPDS